MKTKPLIVLTLLALYAGNTVAAPLSTAFTYQGRLADAGNPAQGSYDLRFAIWDAAADGNIVVGPITNSPVVVSNGAFTTTLDFGAGVFDGNARWLEIGVRTSGSVSDFTLLSPRQPLTPTPYALYTPTAGTAGTAAVATSVGAGAVGTAALQAGAVDSSRIAQGAVGPDQLADAAVTADKLDEGIGFWTRSGDDVFRPSGNVGIATTLPAARLEVKGNPRVDNDEPPQLRLTGGGTGGALSALDLATYDPGTNAPAVRIQATDHEWSADLDILTKGPGADTNALVSRLHITADGKVGIGTMNPEAALQVTGSPRVDNNEPAQLRLTGGAGEGAQSLLDLATYPPGTNAPAARIQATDINFSAGVDILTKEPGAIDNALISRFHVAAGGNVGIGTTDPQATLHVAGSLRADSFSSSGGGPMVLGTTDAQSLEFRVNNVPGLQLEYPTVGSVPNLIGGYGGNAVGSGSEGVVIAGGGAAGYVNTIGTNADFNAIGGGVGNNIADYTWYATIAGGGGNNIGIYADVSTIGGGGENQIGDGARFATIAGGVINDISTNSEYSTIGGGLGNKIGDYTGSATIAGGVYNDVGDNSDDSVIGGGGDNRIGNGALYGTIAGGFLNHIGEHVRCGTIGGGENNNIADYTRDDTIAGGSDNHIGEYVRYSTIGGGRSNNIADYTWYATIAGGGDNHIGTNSMYAVIAGGAYNEVGAEAPYAFAAGRRAKALHRGAFVWADPTDVDFASTATNQFLIRAGGGVGIGTNNPQTALHVAGTITADGFSGSGLGLTTIGTTDTQPLQLRVNDAPALRLEWPTSGSVPNLVGGHFSNDVGSGTEGAVIGGGGSPGYLNTIGSDSDYSAIGGGRDNAIDLNSSAATIGGGDRNEIGVNVDHSVIGGGSYNTIASNAGAATIGGGHYNDIGVNAAYSTIAGGHNNNIASNSWEAVIAGGVNNNIGVNAYKSAIGGGTENQIKDNAPYGTIPGGFLNRAGRLAFAAGFRAKADHTGSFVWADSTDADFASTIANQFLIRASGGVGIGTNDPQAALHVAGSIMADSFSGSGAGLTAIDGGALANSSVTSAKILDGTIANNDLANNSVTSGKIADGSVWNSDLANNAVTSGKIADGTILNSDLANNSVTSGKIQDGQVSSADIADSTITTTDIANGTVSTSDLNLASVDARYVEAAGDTMTGDLAVLGNVNLHDSSLTMYANASNASPRVTITGDSTGGEVIVHTANGSLGQCSYAGSYGYSYYYNSAGNERLLLSGDASDGGYVRLKNASGSARISLHGDYAGTGDGRVITDELQINGGSDLSEQFDIETGAEPGSVVCIDPEKPGKLVVSTKAYDRTVAGIVSGAGGVKPGMMMGQDGTMADGDLPVALSGRVYCRVDASQGAIQPGDLITTSDVPGCGMKVADYSRAHGAIIGKAMTRLDSGQGLILVLVSLH